MYVCIYVGTDSAGQQGLQEPATSLSHPSCHPRIPGLLQLKSIHHTHIQFSTVHIYIHTYIYSFRMIVWLRKQ